MTAHGSPVRWAWLGLVTGPGAWAISTQLNYALVPWSCVYDLDIVPFVAAALIFVALVGGAFSWRARPRDGTVPPGRSPHTQSFIAYLGALLAVLFALVIAMQGSASFFLHGCTR